VLAGIWADVLNREIRYSGDDLDAFE